MKIAIISDIHANLTALEAVMEELESRKPDAWLCLGDLVGYGPKPVECIEIVQSKNMICVLGNHDAGAIGKMPLDHFRHPNRTLMEKTMALLTKAHKKWLASLPLTKTWSAETGESFLLVHASPEEPATWPYLESAFTARRLLGANEEDFILAGHTHKPALVPEQIGSTGIQAGQKHFINPGSVGQPRDGDPRASCGILDLEKQNYENIRVPFDQNKPVEQLMEMGFSHRAAEYMMGLKG